MIDWETWLIIAGTAAWAYKLLEPTLHRDPKVLDFELQEKKVQRLHDTRLGFVLLLIMLVLALWSRVRISP